MPQEKTNWAKIIQAIGLITLAVLTTCAFVLCNLVTIQGHSNTEVLKVLKSCFWGFGWVGIALCICLTFYFILHHYFKSILNKFQTKLDPNTSWALVGLVIIIAFGIWSGKNMYTSLSKSTETTYEVKISK